MVSSLIEVIKFSFCHVKHECVVMVPKLAC